MECYNDIKQTQLSIFPHQITQPIFSGPKGLFAVYCLDSLNPQFKNKCYIGYTPTPKKRIRQHNREISGGARKTKLHGPWRMGMFISGFPTHIAALKFEYIWTYPTDSRMVGCIRSPLITPKNPNSFRDAMQMLQMILASPIYENQPLKINFLHYDLYQLYSSTFKTHQTYYSPDYLTEKGCTVPGDQVYQRQSPQSQTCVLCQQNISQTMCRCYKCKTEFCMSCLAQSLAEQSSTLIPTSGKCPECENDLSWKEILLRTQEELISERAQVRPETEINEAEQNEENDEDERFDQIQNEPVQFIQNEPINVNKEQINAQKEEEMEQKTGGKPKLLIRKDPNYNFLNEKMTKINQQIKEEQNKLIGGGISAEALSKDAIIDID
ncbi:Structure-specific_endonuclease subunit SLX1 [Hexamita inflata]|uniref:Structure-specific endonuclease subunit SLX1 homolog n=1 Tax=Hexamita inflata TaxID=28002 RepID=A0ABP1H8M1_9EUKA